MKTDTSKIQKALVTSVLLSGIAFAQSRVRTEPGQLVVGQPVVEQPDAQRTKDELLTLLQRYPSSLRHVLRIDPSLMNSQPYMVPYPALNSFLAAHPDVVRNPAFYIGTEERESRAYDSGRSFQDQMLEVGSILTALSLAVGLLIWLTRTLINYRRWSRLTKIQTETHTKLMDRFTASDELLAYVKSPAGARFLESTPITLDGGAANVSAPVGRILLSMQVGLVLIAAGVGLYFVSQQFIPVVTNAFGNQSDGDGVRVFHTLGILATSVGFGFVFSAGVSYLISRHLGLLDSIKALKRVDAAYGQE